MSIYRIAGGNLKKLYTLFENWEESSIWSCLQGHMGSAWADSSDKPESAQVVIADFSFFAGKPNEALVKHWPTECPSNFTIMVPQNEEWAALIEKVYGTNSKKMIRYAIKKEPDIFNMEKLKAAVGSLDPDYKLRLIDESAFEKAMSETWSKDLCSQFKNYEFYRKKGLGVAAFYNEILVSGASSYTVYDAGIEVEIDTKEEFRRKGLAYACGAKLILECMSRGLYPSWDAQNKWSLSLAEKLGYHFDKEYVAYEVNI